MNISATFPAEKRLISFLTIVGVLLGLWLAALENGRINVDAVLYLEMARRFAEGDWPGALALYNWPLFPWLVAQVHWLTGLGVENAARLLESLLFGVATWAFLALIAEAGGRRNALMAGAILLFSNLYVIGTVLPMIMRDQGFWAFYLLGLLFFLRFYRSHRFAHVLLWQVCMAIAALFRIEAVSFIILLPLALLFCREQTWRDRIIFLAKNYVVPLSMLFLVLLGMLFLPADELHKKLGRLPEIWGSLIGAYHQINSGLSEKARLYGEVVLGGFLEKYAMWGLCLTLLAALLNKIVGASGFFTFILAVTAKRCQSIAPSPEARAVLLWAASISLINGIVILLKVYLLSSRYIVSLVFIVLFFAAFSLAGLYESWRAQRWKMRGLKTWWFLAVLVAIVYGLASNLVRTNSTYNYEQEAIAWVKQHTPPGARVYYDSARLRYYAQAPWEGREEPVWQQDLLERQKRLLEFDYLVLVVKRRQAEKLVLLTQQFPQFQQVHEFKAKSGDRVVILTKKSNPP